MHNLYEFATFIIFTASKSYTMKQIQIYIFLLFYAPLLPAQTVAECSSTHQDDIPDALHKSIKHAQEIPETFISPPGSERINIFTNEDTAAYLNISYKDTGTVQMTTEPDVYNQGTRSATEIKLRQRYGGLNRDLKISDIETGNMLYVCAALRKNFREATNETKNRVIKSDSQRRLSLYPEHNAGTNFSYRYGNGDYRNQWYLLHRIQNMRDGEDCYIGLQRSYSPRGYRPGTYLQDINVLSGYNKQTQRLQLNVLLAYAQMQSSTATATTAEAIQLKESPYYNPNWGYQQGKVRSAKWEDDKQILVMARLGNQNAAINWKLSTSWVKGRRKYTSPDWYLAADPRPDNYRNLPSFWLYHQALPRPELATMYERHWQADENAGQINWEQLYDRNRSHTGAKPHTGLQSAYVLSSDVCDLQQWNGRATFDIELTGRLHLSLNLIGTFQRNQHYRQLADLLGGDYFVNLNQYAGYNMEDPAQYVQYDLDRPDRTIKTGDRYQYEYRTDFYKAGTLLELMYKRKIWDLNFCINADYEAYRRVGHYRNAVYQHNSKGASALHSFTNYSVQANIELRPARGHTFRIEGQLLQMPPLFNNVFISPRFNNLTVVSPVNEHRKEMEFSYIYTQNVCKVSISGLYRLQTHEVQTLRFFYEDYNSFVSYVLSDVQRDMYALHFHTAWMVHKRFVLSIAGIWLDTRYISIPAVHIYKDNDSLGQTSNSKVYWQGIRPPVGPQTKYSGTASYKLQKPKIDARISAHYHRRNYVQVNPLRFTAEAVDLLAPNTKKWMEIRSQNELPAAFSMDFQISKTFGRQKQGSKRNSDLAVLNIGIYNLLNNRNYILSGFQQLRYDVASQQPAQFPEKYRYAYGRTFSLELQLFF
jgi:hypothetical protein